MAYYHCSTTAGLKVLEPRKPVAFDKPARVYMTTLLPMALMYTVRNYEYTYGYTKEGQIHFDEYFPNEAISETAVPIVGETYIPDACEALLEQERLGNLVIRRHHELPEEMLNWIRKVEADCIRKADLVNTPGPMADYYWAHYPESWAIVENEQNTPGE